MQCRPMEPEPTGIRESICDLEDIRCVLFDVYGTILISGTGEVGTVSESNIGTFLNEALNAAGFEVMDASAGDRGAALLRQEILSDHERKRADGIEYPEVDIRDIWKTVMDRMTMDGAIGNPNSHEGITRLALEYECRVNPVWPMPGLEGALAELRSRDMVLGIVSNAQFYTPIFLRILLNETLEDTGFDPELCVWSYLMKEAKPSIRLYEQSAILLKKKYGVSPSQTLYVGNDMLNDIWPAARIGFRTALFAGDRRSLRLRDDDERIGDTRPDLIVTDLGQIVGAV